MALIDAQGLIEPARLNQEIAQHHLGFGVAGIDHERPLHQGHGLVRPPDGDEEQSDWVVLNCPEDGRIVHHGAILALRCSPVMSHD